MVLGVNGLWMLASQWTFHSKFFVRPSPSKLSHTIPISCKFMGLWLYFSLNHGAHDLPQFPQFLPNTHLILSKPLTQCCPRLSWLAWWQTRDSLVAVHRGFRQSSSLQWPQLAGHPRAAAVRHASKNRRKWWCPFLVGGSHFNKSKA
jgi:hypothetical protein